MDKIKINLLPQEIKDKAKKAAKQALVNRISIGLLGILVMVTSGILAAVIFQGSVVNNLNGQIEQQKVKINGLQDAEAVVKLLKNRLNTINEYDTEKYKQIEVYELVSGLFPQGVSAVSIEVNKTKDVSIQAEADNTVALKIFFDNITDPSMTENKISSATVENLGRSLFGTLEFQLKLHLAEGVI